MMATSTAIARKASTSASAFKRPVPKQQSMTKADHGGVQHHPDDVALDRKNGSN